MRSLPSQISLTRAATDACPDSAEGNLPAMFRSTLHALESWSLSFLVIGSLSNLHHQMIALVKVADTRASSGSICFL